MSSDPTANHPNREPSQGADDERVEAYVRLLGQKQRPITLYVLSLVPRWNDAEEIIQETNLVLWREFGRFELGTNFAAWACKVAFHQVLTWQKRQQRDRLPARLREETVADPHRVEAELLHDRREIEQHRQVVVRRDQRLPVVQVHAELQRPRVSWRPPSNRCRIAAARCRSR